MDTRKLVLLSAGVVLGYLIQNKPAQADETILPTVTVSRVGEGIVGASNSVITAEEIARSGGQTLQDILAREPGIQTKSLYGGVNGAGTSVDMRGFGAFASSNTLVLINGRRVTDLDLAGVDFSTIPKDSIERIEITRGNSGAVLYGDNAVGGVINVVLKSAMGAPPSARLEGGFGAYGRREGALSAAASSGPWSYSAFGNLVGSDGWRKNNALKQGNGVGDLRYSIDGFSAFLTISGDDQKLGFPGPRSVTLTSSQLASDPRGTSTPFDYGNKQGVNVTTGFTRQLTDQLELIVDGGVRHKMQQAGFFSNFGADFDSYVDTTLTTYSLTPRAIHRATIAGMPSKLVAGVDLQDAVYGSDRPRHAGEAPIHRYDLEQKSAAGYFQETLGLLPTTDLSFGGRVQRNYLTARDRFDINAPGGVFASPPVEGLPLDKGETQHALHVGVEHRLNDVFTAFGRVARSFRFANVDERIGLAPWGTPTNFDLKTQTSHDAEAGLRIKHGRFRMQTSGYVMDLTNEIHFDPVNFVNYNLDPTRRYGVETAANYQLSDTVRLRGGAAYTRAIFREGANAGHDVPVVSRWTASGGVSWDVWRKWLTVDAQLRYVGPRRMDNDQRNFQPMIPGHVLLDVAIGGEIDRFFWSASVQNVFKEYYFDYAVASAFTYGSYNAYPQPGRLFLVKGGFKL